MIVTHTFLSRCNTIVKGSLVNLSFNPIMELHYGNTLTRGLLYFNTDKIKQLYNDKVYPDISKMKHVLKMTNTSSLKDFNINIPFPESNYSTYRERALSFDLILFKIPELWDDGRGFDYIKDIYLGGKRSFSEDGSNWYNSKNFDKWSINPGIYSTDQLYEEYDNFENCNKSIIVGKQHFEYGNESLEIDITDYVNEIITSNNETTSSLENFGLCLAFSPEFENTITKLSQYIGFFTNHTNSFFEPYVETTYNDNILDDRRDFYMNKDNKLYFYAKIGGDSVNLDKLPTCTINQLNLPVKQATKGIYYIDINMSENKIIGDGVSYSGEFSPETMYYDTWSNIVYNGVEFPNSEMYFTTKSMNDYYSFGFENEETVKNTIKFIPSLYGINEDEKILGEGIRKINIECKIPYTSDQLYPVNKIQYRLYSKQGEKEITVIDWEYCDRYYLTNSFLIDLDGLVPGRYYIDIKVKYDFEEITHKNMLQFIIVNDYTEIYC